MKKSFCIYSCLVLLSALLAFSANPSICQAAGGDKKPPYNALDDRKNIEDWRGEQYEKLRREGKATKEEFAKIDNEALKRHRGLEHKRQNALNEIFEQAGVKMPAQTGTTAGDPESRGVLGDTDFENLSPRDRDKVLKAAKRLGYDVKPQGDAFTIKELDSTVHREAYKRSGGPAQQSEQGGRAAGKETAYSYGGKDPATGKPKITDQHVNTMDNLKKGAHTLTADPGKMTGDDWASLGKMTSRNMANGGIENTGLKTKADMLKMGYSPEAAGIVPDNATPQQRERSLREFHQQCRQANVQAYSNTSKMAEAKKTGLTNKVNQAEAELQAAIKNPKSTQSEINEARQKLRAATEERALYNTKQSAAKHAVEVNQGESVIKELENAPNRERASAKSKGKDPGSPGRERPATSEPGGKTAVREKVKNLVKDNLTIEKGGGLFIFGYEAYEGYKRRMEEDPKRGRVDAAASAILEATGIPAMHTIAVKKQKENEGQPGKATVETMFEWTKAILVGGAEYVADKAKNIPKARQEFVEKRIAEMDADRRDRISKAEHEQQKKYIYDALIKEGASPAGASRAVAALEQGNATPLNSLRRVLKIKKGVKGEPGKEDKAVAKEMPDKKLKALVATDTVKKEQPMATDKSSVEAEGGAGPISSPSSAGVDSEPRNDAGEKVDVGAYEQGDRIVTGDGTEYEKKGGNWVRTGSNYGSYEPKSEKARETGTQGAGGGSVGQVADAGHTGSGRSSAGNQNDGKSQGLEWVQNVNVTRSYKDGHRSKAKGKEKENLKNSGLVVSERVTAEESEDKRQKGMIASQGMETGHNIGGTQQEGKKAQDTGRIMSETSIGTILAGGLMGGLSSGVATGLDSFFGTLGQGAGGQVSATAGIQPPPPPRAEPAIGSAATTAAETANGHETSGVNEKSTGAGASSGTATPGVSGTATPGVSGTTAPTAKPTTKVTKPVTTTTVTVAKPTTATAKPATVSTKPTTTKTPEVSKPDCSQYRISAENLTSQYEQGLISTSAYQAQMRILRTKYKGCQDTARTPTTSGTSKTSTQGSTTKKTTEKKMQSCGQAPMDVWHCHGYTGSCCTKGWHCEGNNCGPLDPAVYKATQECMRKLGIIR